MPINITKAENAQGIAGEIGFDMQARARRAEIKERNQYREQVSMGQAMRELADLIERDATWIEFHYPEDHQAIMVAVNLAGYAGYLRAAFPVQS